MSNSVTVAMILHPRSALAALLERNIGGLPTTNTAGKRAAKLILTPEKSRSGRNGYSLPRPMLSQGQYLGDLYDIGFDKPETHAIRKDDSMYYAFYAPQWRGSVTLRGLGSGRYKVVDYVNAKPLGS